MSIYSHSTYYLQEELTHFGLRITTDFDVDVMGQFDIDTNKQKIGKFFKYF